MSDGPTASGGVDLILDVVPISTPLTGIGVYAVELATRLRRTPGVRRVRYAARGRWVDDVEARLAAPPRSRMPWDPRVQAMLRPVHGLVRLARAAREARAFRHEADALYHGTNFAVPAFPGPAIATIHDLSVLRHPGFHPATRVDTMKRALELTTRRASFLIADSEFTRREIVELLSWPVDRVAAVHLGVGPEFRPREPSETGPVLRRLGLRHGEYALCVASIEPRKNVDGLIAAYATLPARLRERYPLVLAGPPGWNSADTHRRIRGLAADGWLRWTGYLSADELPLVIAGARGFVYPSFYEGFGLPVAEAMASGVPVATSDRASLPEITAGAALLADPSDPAALALAIRRLLEDEQWRAAASQASLDVAAGYSWDTTVARTVDIYRRVVDGTGAASTAGTQDPAIRRGASAPPAGENDARPGPARSGRIGTAPDDGSTR